MLRQSSFSFFFSSRRRHTRFDCDWSSDVCSSDLSFSDDPAKLGAPSGFTLQVRDILPSAGAGFVVALAGDIMTMPGLSKSPAAERIRVHPDGTIEGLF